ARPLWSLLSACSVPPRSAKGVGVRSSVPPQRRGGDNPLGGELAAHVADHVVRRRLDLDLATRLEVGDDAGERAPEWRVPVLVVGALRGHERAPSCSRSARWRDTSSICFRTSASQDVPAAISLRW